MRTRRFEQLRPEELAREREKNSLVYLPVGLLEWHSYAMPMGTDAIVAEKACLLAAKLTGGVVLPTLYCAPALIREDGLKAMESAYSCTKSVFFSQELFQGMIDRYLHAMAEQGYKKILIVVGHGSAGFTDVIDKICKNFESESDSKAAIIHAWATQDIAPYSLGHATIIETSLMMYLTDSVELKKLPPEPEPLFCRKMGMDDPAANPDGTVNEVDDPRRATVELGKKIFDRGIINIVGFVNGEDFD